MYLLSGDCVSGPQVERLRRKGQFNCYHSVRMTHSVSVLALCAALRPEVVPMVDAFDIPDWVLRSPLATYTNERAYENYLRTMRNAPGGVGVPHYFERQIAPLTASKL